MAAKTTQRKKKSKSRKTGQRATRKGRVLRRGGVGVGEHPPKGGVGEHPTNPRTKRATRESSCQQAAASRGVRGGAAPPLGASKASPAFKAGTFKKIRRRLLFFLKLPTRLRRVFF